MQKKTGYLTLPAFLLIFNFTSVHAQGQPISTSTPANRAEIGTNQNALSGGWKPLIFPNCQVQDFQSKLGRRYCLYLATPERIVAGEQLPVVYVLDADDQFLLVVELLKRQNRGTLPCYVVGIGYGLTRSEIVSERTFDYTTPACDAWIQEFEPQYVGKKVGGADQFLNFLQEELMPFVQSVVPVDGKREYLIGHSLSGLFVSYVYLEQPDLFDGYIAMSPSLWWANENILRRLTSNPNPKSGRMVDLELPIFLSVGELEETANNPEDDARKRLLERRRMIQNVKSFAAMLRMNQKSQVNCNVIAGSHYGSVVAPALVQAFHELFLIASDR